MAEGKSEEEAETEVRNTLPTKLRPGLPRRFYLRYRPRFKPVPGYKQRVMSRSIDPTPFSREIDTHFKPTRIINPIPSRARIIDPISPAIILPPTAKGFSATKQEALEITKEAITDDADLSAASASPVVPVVNDEPFYMNKKLWIGVAVIGALAVAAHQSNKKKGGKPLNGSGLSA
jgi:hypothetical protein